MSAEEGIKKAARLQALLSQPAALTGAHAHNAVAQVTQMYGLALLDAQRAVEVLELQLEIARDHAALQKREIERLRGLLDDERRAAATTREACAAMGAQLDGTGGRKVDFPSEPGGMLASGITARP